MNKASTFEGRGVYSDKAILKAIESDHIVCTPLNKKNINGSSIDLTLGEWFYTITDKRTLPKIYNPFDPEHILQKFEGPHRAEPHKSVMKRLGLKPLKNIPLKHPVIILEPGERILAHTHEFVGIHSPGTSSMQSRSTWGRNGVVTCLDAGWGDPGYVNRWTMEIKNEDAHQPVVLPVGERISQLVFYYTPETAHEYAALTGKYQSFSSSEVKKMIKSWKPEDMLPKAWKDKRKLPLPITGF